MSNTPRTDAHIAEHGACAGLNELAAHYNDLLDFARLLEMELDDVHRLALAPALRLVEHWKRMYECAQNANALRQAAIDGCAAPLDTTVREER